MILLPLMGLVVFAIFVALGKTVSILLVMLLIGGLLAIVGSKAA